MGCQYHQSFAFRQKPAYQRFTFQVANAILRRGALIAKNHAHLWRQTACFKYAVARQAFPLFSGKLRQAQSQVTPGDFHHTDVQAVSNSAHRAAELPGAPQREPAYQFYEPDDQ